MADQQEASPFTNARLMIAGIILGAIGAVLTLHVINSKIDEATGGTVEVCVLKRDLDVGEHLTKEHVRLIPVPQLFAEAVEQVMKKDDLWSHEGQRPLRNMWSGEMLSVRSFLEESERQEAVMSQRDGVVTTTVKLDSRRNLGRLLSIGDIVNVVGVFILDPEEMPEGETLLVLENVRVVGINGKLGPSDKVTTVNIEVGQKSSNLVTYLGNVARQKGSYTIDKAVRDARTSDVGKEVPKECYARLRLTVGLPPSF
jgi:Flp pilus assembly protein CpaB